MDFRDSWVLAKFRFISSFLTSGTFAGFGLGEERLPVVLKRLARRTGVSLLAQLADDGRAGPSGAAFELSSLLPCLRIGCD